MAVYLFCAKNAKLNVLKLLWGIEMPLSLFYSLQESELFLQECKIDVSTHASTHAAAVIIWLTEHMLPNVYCMEHLIALLACLPFVHFAHNLDSSAS